MTNHQFRGASVCAIVIAIGLVLPASAQPMAKEGTFSRVPLQMKVQSTDLNRQTLIAAKQRPEALKLRESFRGNFAANRVNLVEIDKSSVPVLVSARPALVQNLRVFAKLDRYTASTRQNGAVIEINGTRLPAQAPKDFRLPKTIRTIRLDRKGAAPAPNDALQDVRIDHTGSGVDMSFTRFGSVYNLTIDCGEAAADDPEAIGPAENAAPNPAAGQCTDENALSIAKEMEVIGGGEAAQ